MNRVKNTLPFLISLSLHLLAAILVFQLKMVNQEGSGNEEGQEQQMGQGGAQDENIVPKQVEIEMVERPPLVTEQSEVEVPKEQDPKEGLTECENDLWFGGIGIREGLDSTVEEVYQGYPAEKFGIKVNDKIMLVDGVKYGEIRGEPGTNVRILVFRSSTNEYLTFTIKRDKICIGARK